MDKLSTCDPRLQLIIKRASETSRVDFGVSCGNRSIEDQQKVFKEGKSDIDGITELSKHNYLPSKAVDIFGYVNGKADYSIPVMCYLAGVIQAIAFDLGIPIRQGLNWDGDGEILTDQPFDDLPHIELL